MKEKSEILKWLTLRMAMCNVKPGTSTALTRICYTFSFANSIRHLWRAISEQIMWELVFSYLSEPVLCPRNNSKSGRRSKTTSPFLFPSCREAVTWKSLQGIVFFLAYRQIFIVQEFGVRTKHWWQGPWKVELHSIFFQWFMFSTQQPPFF